MIKNAFINQAKEHAPNIFWSNLNFGIFTASALIISVVFARFGGKELEYRIIAVNKSGDGEPSNTAMVVL